jgi:hypothetical protein
MRTHRRARNGAHKAEVRGAEKDLLKVGKGIVKTEGKALAYKHDVASNAKQSQKAVKRMNKRIASLDEQISDKENQ